MEDYNTIVVALEQLCAEYPGKVLNLSIADTCLISVQNWILANATIFGGLTAILAGLQIVGICFACCLSKSILKDYHDFYY